jgi:hypothetical protein
MQLEIRVLEHPYTNPTPETNLNSSEFMWATEVRSGPVARTAMRVARVGWEGCVVQWELEDH